MEFHKRDLLKNLGTGAIGINQIDRLVKNVEAARKSDDEPVPIDVEENSQYPIIAYTTLSEAGDFELYVAVGVESMDEQAERTVKIDDSSTTIQDLDWVEARELQYWVNGAVYSVNLGSDGQVISHSKVRDQGSPEELQTEIPETGAGDLGTASTGEISTTGCPNCFEPAPGGGDGPDWMDDPEAQLEEINRCRTLTQTGYPKDVCIDTNGSISPRFIVNCYGRTIPVIGTSLSPVGISDNVGYSRSVAIDILIGVNPETGCLIIASSTFNFCYSTCFNSRPTYAEFEQEIMEDLKRELKSVLQIKLNSVLDFVWEVIKAFAILIIGVIILIAFGILIAVLEAVTGGAIGA